MAATSPSCIQSSHVQYRISSLGVMFSLSVHISQLSMLAVLAMIGQTSKAVKAWEGWIVTAVKRQCLFLRGSTMAPSFITIIMHHRKGRDYWVPSLATSSKPNPGSVSLEPMCRVRRDVMRRCLRRNLRQASRSMPLQSNHEASPHTTVHHCGSSQTGVGSDDGDNPNGEALGNSSHLESHHPPLQTLLFPNITRPEATLGPEYLAHLG